MSQIIYLCGNNSRPMMSYADVNPSGFRRPAPIRSLKRNGVEDRLIIKNLGRQNPKETLLSYDPVDSNSVDKDDLGAEDLGKLDLEEQAADENQVDIENPEDLEEDDLEEQASNENQDDIENPDASEDSKK